MLLFLAGLGIGLAAGVLLMLLVVNLTTDPLQHIEIPKPSLPKKRMSPGVYHPTNVAAVRKALRMGVSEEDVLK